MAGFIELPGWLNGRAIERIYGRTLALQNMGKHDRYAQQMVAEGLRRARARDARLLLTLEKGADYLQKRNDEQKSRFRQEGLPEHLGEFSEYTIWREAYQRANEPVAREDDIRVFKWQYAAVNEFLR